ncbi:hypothetical protein [Fictibacillus terranigra]|uniref:Lipoprotein n=1 Tax=Fictibacillus terranigra TaxID=3058424 RepID=A0ABT8E218_9BACL|nr:hypothetical protein [Fictibacillus sp. CENA-BCM004]MDN4071947.1 hypothetical protein [Fictibacillus sp. CENA-BCM004]
MLKYLKSILLIILLASCSSPGEKDHLRSKEITLQIVNTQEKNQHYLLTVTTDGTETDQSAVLPKSLFVITNENKEARVKLNLNSKYTIKAAKTPVTNIDEFQNKKKRGQKVAGPLLASVDFTPTKDSDTLKIKINNDNH